jgi:rhamnogalacturonyl hydrolase YesR
MAGKYDEREKAFLVALQRTGDPVEAAREAGYEEPRAAARFLMTAPRVRAALRSIERAQAAGIGMTANRILARWLDHVGMWMKTVEDPRDVPIKEVIRASKLAADIAQRADDGARKEELHNVSLAALEAVASKIGVDLGEITGRRLIDVTPEEVRDEGSDRAPENRERGRPPGARKGKVRDPSAGGAG